MVSLSHIFYFVIMLSLSNTSIIYAMSLRSSLKDVVSSLGHAVQHLSAEAAEEIERETSHII